MTVSMNLDHTPGLLSSVLNSVAGEGANILTINQTIPSGGCAAVTITTETMAMAEPIEDLLHSLAAMDGVVKAEILAG